MAALVERFEAKYSKRGLAECWPWTATRTSHGYGQFWLDGRLEIASRVAYALAHGPIPAGLSVLHRCDNPPCVNPGHLFLGTHADNMADREAKGRNRPGPGAPPPHYTGERNPAARLTAGAVADIRRAAGKSVSSLAREHGVSRRTIRRVLTGASWPTEAFGR